MTSIRDVATADLPAIQAIYEREVLTRTATFELEPPDLAELERRVEAVRAAGMPWLVAEIDGAVAGYAYAGPYRARPAYRLTVENSVYVDDAFLRRGVARALMDEVIRLCAEAGLREMVAVIGDSANAASIGLHAALGFRLIGTLTGVGYKHGRWLDTVIMQRPLAR
ncbi:MAG TPA: N-acetyltransferase family protein [Geminicoccaceae bacterium]|nr:N-acetyltransferase family protein [Geminicoccus sp.]HMU53049.1 N-acetyltransferase family protein [Geminicoccaceae bacterium]